MYCNYVYAPHFQNLATNYNDVSGTLTIIDDSGMNLGVRTHVTAFHAERTAGGSLPMMFLEDTYTASGNPQVYKSRVSRTTGYHNEGVDESDVVRFTINYYGQYECTTAGRGIILKSPNGTRYELSVSNAGAVVVTPA